jgi:hypothetical protein
MAQELELGRNEKGNWLGFLANGMLVGHKDLTAKQVIDMYNKGEYTAEKGKHPTTGKPTVTVFVGDFSKLTDRTKVTIKSLKVEVSDARPAFEYEEESI